MKIGTNIKKLRKRVKREKSFKSNIEDPFEDKVLLNLSRDRKPKISENLNFLKKVLKMIEEGATGFDLAYEVEKNQEIKNLIYDGILFYNTFLEIGNSRFIDAPDKKEMDYKSFKTIEDTEKFIFMVWLRDIIESIEKEIKTKEDYYKYLEAKKAEELKKAQEILCEKLTHCKNCGERIKSKEQEFCEKCGIKLLEIH